MTVPNVIATFLVKFDMKLGNTIIWSNNIENFIDQGLEYKSMPSGIHDQSNDTIIFTVRNHVSKELQYGLSSFQQNSFDLLKDNEISSNHHLNRKIVKMYSFGVIFNISSLNDTDFLFHYKQRLNHLLDLWLRQDNLNDFTILQSLKQDDKIDINNKSKLNWNHNIFNWCERFGPLLFPIWKSCLLNHRILILNSSSYSIWELNSLCFLIQSLSSSSKSKNLINLGTIGISDLDHMNDSPYIACTNDSLLEYKTEIYDILIKLDENNHFTIYNNQSIQIKATPNDQELNIQLNNLLNINNGISSSIVNNDRIEPLTWTQYLWDELYLVLTAGYWKPSYHDHIIDPISSSSTNHDFSLDDNILPFITKLFQSRTKILYNSLETVLLSKEFDELTDDIIYLHPKDLKTLQLDCFSEQDFQFIIKLSSVWFNKTVEINGYIEYLNIAC